MLSATTAKHLLIAKFVENIKKTHKGQVVCTLLL